MNTSVYEISSYIQIIIILANYRQKQHKHTRTHTHMFLKNPPAKK